MSKLKLVLGLLLAALVGANVQLYRGRAEAQSAFAKGRLQGCNDLLKGVNGMLAPFPLDCREYKGHTVITSDVQPGIPKIDVFTGERVD